MIALRMTDAAIEQVGKALDSLHGPDRGGDNTLRRLNDAAFIGERFGRALRDDWLAMRAEIERLNGLLSDRERPKA